MPIVRTYMCPACAHHIEVTLDADQWDAPPPACPECERREMQQDFKPVAIGGSNRAKAETLTENILREDYGVADMQREHRPHGTPSQVRYQSPLANPSRWGVAKEALEGAIALGRQSRIRHGSGLDILQANLKSGAEPDLLEISKRRAMRVWE